MDIPHGTIPKEEEEGGIHSIGDCTRGGRHLSERKGKKLRMCTDDGRN